MKEAMRGLNQLRFSSYQLRMAPAARLHSSWTNGSQGTEAVRLDGIARSDVKPLDIAHLFHGAMKLFHAPMLVMQALKLCCRDGFQSRCVWQKQAGVTVFVLEDRAKKLDDSHLFEWHQPSRRGKR